MRRGGVLLVAVAWAIVFGGKAARGETLSASLARFVNDNTAVSGSAGGEALASMVGRLATRGTALPATSTLPGFTYRYNVELGLFEREAGALGPALLDRGETIGKGNFAIGMSYLYADLKNLNGTDFAKQVDFGTQLDLPDGTSAAGFMQFRQFDLYTNIITLFATYGITDRWDVNVLAPLVQTRLDVRATVDSACQGPTCRVQGILPTTSPRLKNEAFGFGDVLLRTKYRLMDGDPFNLATGLTLRTPTGREDEYAGLGDFTVEPILILSRVFGRHDVHANLGMEVNADDLQRTRARYGAGISLEPFERVAFLVDLFGSSSFVKDTYSVDVNVPSVVSVQSDFLRRFQSAPQQRLDASTVRFSQFIARSDIVDLSVGVKVNLFSTATAFLAAIVPVVENGLRAPVSPTGGVQYTF